MKNKKSVLIRNYHSSECSDEARGIAGNGLADCRPAKNEYVKLMSMKKAKQQKSAGGNVPVMRRSYTGEGRCVLFGGAVAYECESLIEARKIIKAANRFIREKGRDHRDWNELRRYMNAA